MLIVQSINLFESIIECKKKEEETHQCHNSAAKYGILLMKSWSIVHNFIRFIAIGGLRINIYIYLFIAKLVEITPSVYAMPYILCSEI